MLSQTTSQRPLRTADGYSHICRPGRSVAEAVYSVAQVIFIIVSVLMLLTAARMRQCQIFWVVTCRTGA
jgi:hypothetical protein